MFSLQDDFHSPLTSSPKRPRYEEDGPWFEPKNKQRGSHTKPEVSFMIMSAM